jgi:hypothetical protein
LAIRIRRPEGLRHPGGGIEGFSDLRIDEFTLSAITVQAIGSASPPPSMEELKDLPIDELTN